MVETTGCGDCSMAATLAQLAGQSVAQLGEIGAEKLEAAMRVANAAAEIVAKRVGAAGANPTQEKVQAFLDKRAK
jgi:sugar/nucleoside kinase (ribokinase family)